MIIKNININWAQFESCNQDFRYTFEKMCRMLFNHYFFDGTAILHSNPNNPGIEVLPILDTTSNKRISFQSKYFSTTIDYSQIKHSAVKAIEHYGGELDLLYLYCNKDLTTTSKPYKEIEEILEQNNIELVLINNQSILDQVLQFPLIATYFFKQHSINETWFKDNIQESLEALGTKYNSLFNVNTLTEDYLDLFTCNKRGVNFLNNKKNQAVEEINSMLKYPNDNENYLIKAKEIIESLEEITPNNVKSCLNWEKILSKNLMKEIIILEKQYGEIEREIQKLRDEEDNKRSALYIKRRKLIELIDIPNLLQLSTIEKKLIDNKSLFIKGEAGVGKSQLFANLSKKIIDEQGFAILMLGHTFITKDSIFNQLLTKLNLDQNFDELLLVLENIALQNQQYIILFIDGINESPNREIWKLNLNSLIKKIEKFNFIKIAFSFRNGYENTLLDDTINSKIKDNKITIFQHYGFRNETIEATKEFLNAYNIPFTATSFLQYELTNPLFLTLFCKAFSGEELDMLELFDNLIENSDQEIQKALEYDGTTRLLPFLITEIIEYIIEKKPRNITKPELFKLDFWKTYGIESKKIQFISLLEKTDILYTFVSEGVEHYYFSYNLLEDFLIAKSIMNKYPSQDQLVYYIKNKLLLKEKNNLVNPNNIDVFMYVCMLYAEKYNQECIYLIDSLDEYDQKNIISKYIKSYSMRKTSSINEDFLMNVLKKFSVNSDDFFSMLIENSAKSNHPLNGDFLHNFLIKRPLAVRDSTWTIYINDLSFDDERLYQLINLFHKGSDLKGLKKGNIEQILILFTWILSSSNRQLRDKTSKAMIEILKDNIDLCLILLMKFEKVDDPYVVQRLYGITFGAIIRKSSNSHDDFKNITLFVYNSIFKKEIVYPDILLRDYARLIIERFIYENPNHSLDLDFSKVIPPYQSYQIPKVKYNTYDIDDKSGFYRIVVSMQPDRINGPGMYGDFGRYVFQSALNKFVGIDLENIYHYSLQYIKEELKYTDKYFGNFDKNIHHPLVRSGAERYERIGKKYQWIAMYHILALVSDYHKIKGDSEREDYVYKGAYDPYVRDFDPTLNDNFLLTNDVFELKSNYQFEVDFLENSENDIEIINEWIERKTSYFSSHSDKLVYIDSTGDEWVLLNEYEEKIRGDGKIFGSSNSEQRLWSMSNSYLVREDQFDNFKDELLHKNFMGRWFPESHSTYTLYNGEYPWSYSCGDSNMNNWEPFKVKLGVGHTEQHQVEFPVFNDYDYENGSLVINYETKIIEKEVFKTKYLGEIVSAYSELTWEEEYDYSNRDRYKNILFPTKYIYEGLGLHQKNNVGYYYDNNDELIAFDGRLTEISSGLLIKKNQLINFLNENNLKIFWTCLGEKQFFYGNREQIWSEWSGFLFLDNGKIVGEMNYIKSSNNLKK